MRWLVALLCASTVAVAARAEERPESYATALAALDAGDAVTASRLLREAIALAPGESAGPPSYLPHFYLGLAQWRLNNCLLALREWRLSEDQRAILDLPEAEELARGREACDQSLVQPQIERAGRALVSVEELLKLAEAMRDDPALAARFAPGTDPGGRLAAGESLVRSARARLALAERDRDLGAALEAQDFAADAQAQLGGLADSVLADDPPLPGPASARARPAPETSATGRPPRAGGSEAVEAELARAAPLFFSGDYAGCLAALATIAEAGTPATRARALLVRAAASFALWRSNGQAGDALLARARGDAAAALALDPLLRPQAELFSPAFRRFWTSAAPSPAG